MNLDPLFDALLETEAGWMLSELDADEVVRLWLDLEHASAILRKILRLVAEDAAGRLIDRDDPRAPYETSDGQVVHLEPGYRRETWQGRRLLADELAVPMVSLDPATGELGPVHHAVPLDVLLDVLPGVADDDATSSRWRVTGLRRHVADWHRYRHRDDAPLVIRRGPPWTVPPEGPDE